MEAEKDDIMKLFGVEFQVPRTNSNTDQNYPNSSQSVTDPTTTTINEETGPSSTGVGNSRRQETRIDDDQDDHAEKKLVESVMGKKAIVMKNVMKMDFSSTHVQESDYRNSATDIKSENEKGLLVMNNVMKMDFRVRESDGQKKVKSHVEGKGLIMMKNVMKVVDFRDDDDDDKKKSADDQINSAIDHHELVDTSLRLATANYPSTSRISDDEKNVKSGEKKRIFTMKNAMKAHFEVPRKQ